MLVKENIQDIYTLSPLQEGMFFHALYEPTSIAYFQQQSFRQNGYIDIKNLELSLNELFKRYDILRTVFVYKKNTPLQIVLKQRQIDFFYKDLTNKRDKYNAIVRYKEQDKLKFFDLGKSVLMRVAVFKIDENEFELIWSWHHILMDAWCVGFLKNEFYEIYNGLCSGDLPTFSEVKQYKNYIDWLVQKDKQIAKGFWNSYLMDYQVTTDIPKKTASVLYDKKEFGILLDPTEINLLQHIAKTYKVTLNAIIQTIWGILLSKYNNQQDIVFGTIVSGRPADVAGIETMIGLFINALPVRVKYDADTSFLELLKEVAKNNLDANQFSYCSLSEIQAEVINQPNLINHILLFQNFLTVESEIGMYSGDVENKKTEVLNVESFEHYFYDLNFFVLPGKTFSLLIKYNANVYEEITIVNVLQYFKKILRQIKLNINIIVSEISLATIEKTTNILSNRKVTYENSTRLISDLFEHEVKLHPNAKALVFKDIVLTYSKLNEEANRLAHCLINKYGVVADDKVGILLDRSERMIIALLAILKAGAAFLPLDQSSPVERKKFIIKDAGIEVLITDADFLLETEAFDVELIVLDLQLGGLESDDSNPEPRINGNNLAYVIYTSGSTGYPKGVEITSDNLYNYITWANKYYFNNENGFNFPLFTSLSFDLTLTSIFSTLLRGDILYICDNVDAPQNLRNIFESNASINTIKLTPAHVSLLAGLEIKSTNIKLAIVGGEALTKEHIKVLQNISPQIRIFNEYGPTETTIGCMVKEINDMNDIVTIGHPISNTQVLILNEQRQIQPQGIAGELFISGMGVAKGYLNHVNLTKESFIDELYPGGGIWYKTGDFGRMLFNGEIEYLGRLDNEFKIRGHRIHLAEIESTLIKHHLVREAIVLGKKDKSEGVIIAFFVGEENLDLSVVQNFLGKFLPAYMIPTHLVRVSNVPLTNNGKIDRSALLANYQISLGNDKVVTSPRNDTEAHLVNIWSEILGRTQIGVDESFFSIGGHSLKAIQLTSRIAKEFDVQISLSDVFDYQTIEKLSNLILRSKKTAFNSIPVIEEQEHYDVSYAQKRFLVSNYLKEGDSAYNISKAYTFYGFLDIIALEQSFDLLIKRHEVLRTRFININWEFKQKVESITSFNFKLHVLDYRDREDIELDRIICEDTVAPFDLEKGPLLRAKLIQLKDDVSFFIFTMHHIVSDNWTKDILINEVLMFYESFTKQDKIVINDNKLQYKDYTAWQNTEICDKNIKKYTNYWLEKLNGAGENLNFPTDYLRPDIRTYKGNIQDFSVDNQLKQQLINLSSKLETSVFVILLTAFKGLIYRYVNQSDILIGTVVSGRNHIELESQIGFYMNTIPLRTKISDQENFKDLVSKVKETVVNALEHQFYPFNLLLDKLKINRSANRAPLFDIVISYQTSENRSEEGAMINIDAHTYRIKKEFTIYDLIIDINQSSQGLFFTINYNTDLFKTESILNLGEQYKVLLLNIVKDHHIKISNIQFSGLAQGQLSDFSKSFDLDLS